MDWSSDGYTGYMKTDQVLDPSEISQTLVVLRVGNVLVGGYAQYHDYFDGGFANDEPDTLALELVVAAIAHLQRSILNSEAGT
jgi:hypothetical protein